MRRRAVQVTTAPGGWPAPWPNVAELASVLPADTWTLVGGLMTQLHTIHRGIGVVRPTNDVDIVLHIEARRGVPAATAHALESVGYRLLDAMAPRDNTAHRFVRDEGVVDLVTGTAPTTEPRGHANGHAAMRDTVDVLRSDHSPPRVVESLRGRTMVAIDGGTQALRRTIDAHLELEPGVVTTVSVPRPFGAVILKAAAFVADSRTPMRHLHDAAALLACIEDPFIEREGFAGSDRSRLLRLTAALPPEHPAWRSLPSAARSDAMATLRVLVANA